MEMEDLKERLRKSLKVIQVLQGQLDAAKLKRSSAIIGMSCKLPGGINDLENLWDFLYKGGDAITGYPAERLAGLNYTEEDVQGIKGGFIKNIDLFDPAFFNVGLSEASAMDPQHRLLLEMTWRAFEDAGLDIQGYRGKKVGVFIAISNNDYSLNRLRSENSTPYDFTGNILAPAAGRISYAFDFRGPCLVTDTACSSSLVAFHQAHTALINNECDIAVVGGINLVLDLQINKALQQIDALAADGHCKPLDASADGYARSEGGGVLILKREGDLAEGKDKPYCIVKGTCVNHDGHSNGFTAPSGNAQEAVLNGALKAAGMVSGDIDYIELHGTGTALGDPIEVDALQNVFMNEKRETPLYIGSVKSNMGHLECAAGLAGIFKAVLVVKNRIVPPTIHIRKLNPLIDWRDELKIPRMPERLNTGREKIRAGISSFGISGTNAHVIIESVAEQEERVSVPGHQFENIVCWVNKEKKSGVSGNLGTACTHPVFDQKFSLPGEENSTSFTGTVSLKQLPWLEGHKLFDKVIYPGAGFLEWMLFAANSLGVKNGSVAQLILKEPLVLNPGEVVSVWLKASKEDNGYSCNVYSKRATEVNWLLHAQCKVDDTQVSSTGMPVMDIAGEDLDIVSFYKKCQKAGIGYSGSFALLQRTEVKGSWLTGTIGWQTPVQPQKFALHPALLDNCFQVLGAYLLNKGEDAAYMPYKMGAVTQYGGIADGEVDVTIQLPDPFPRGFNSLKVDVYISQGSLLKASIKGFHLVKVLQEQLGIAVENELAKHVYTEEWVEELLDPVTQSQSNYKLADFSSSLQNIDTILASRAANGLKVLEELALHWCASILINTGAQAIAGKEYTSADLMKALAIVPAHKRLFERLLDVSVEQGWATVKNCKYLFTKIPATNIQANIAAIDNGADINAELSVLNNCAGNIASIMKGQTDPVDVLFPSGSIEQIKSLYASDPFKVMHSLTADVFKEFLEKNKHNGPLRILEIGAGTGSTTAQILPLFNSDATVYDFTDISPLFLHEAKNRFGEYGFVNYRTLDIEKDISEQGFDLESYDLIIASNVLHATRNLKDTFGSVKQLLKSDGVLFMVEGTSRMLWIDLIFGITSGWWLFNDTDLRPSHALLSIPQWKSFLENDGFEDVQILSPQVSGASASGQSIVFARKGIDNTVKPLLLLSRTKELPQYWQGVETLVINEHVSVPLNRPIIVEIDTEAKLGTAKGTLVRQSIDAFSILAELRKEDGKRLIMLVATGNQSKAFTGLWRSLQNECKDWDIRLMIVEKADDNLHALIKTELASGAHSECCIWNGGVREVLRLQHVAVSKTSKKIDWTGKSILVTGGAGGVGLQLAKWLLKKGAEKIYLTGRNAIAKIKLDDTRIVYLQSDIVGNSPEVKEDFYAIFHLAGVVADSLFEKQSEISFDNVLAPKVSGTENIVHYALEHGVKHVVLFSSSAGMLGTVGQTNHALASAWLQNATVNNYEVNITSIAWGPWKGAGAVEKYDVENIASRIGVKTTDASVNFDMMEQVMVSDKGAVGIFDMNWNTYSSSMKETPYWTGLIDKHEVFVATGGANDLEDILKKGNVENMIACLRGIVSHVLGYKETRQFDADAGFFDIGIDSLTALDLKKHLQQATKLEMPSTLIFKYPNIRSVANYLLDSIAPVSMDIVIKEEKWNEPIDALSFIEAEFNNLLDDTAAN